MENTKVKTLSNVDMRAVARFLALAAVMPLLPFFIHLQWITGPAVNALLIIALFLSGYRGAFVLCFVPSLAALAGGLLPAVMAPAIPFVILGNIIFISGIHWMYYKFKDNTLAYWMALGFGALFKFFPVYLGALLATRFWLEGPIADKIAVMLSWPQLFTALTGGMAAWVVLKIINRI